MIRTKTLSLFGICCCSVGINLMGLVTADTAFKSVFAIIGIMLGAAGAIYIHREISHELIRYELLSETVLKLNTRINLLSNEETPKGT